MDNHWKGKKVAFLGDSITDPAAIPTVKKYWKFLEESLGIQPFVYGVNGANWSGILGQAMKLQSAQGDDIDAIFIFCGTNDYNGSTPIGEWFSIEIEETNDHGSMSFKPHRHLVKDTITFRGRINTAMEFLKENFTSQQIVMMTPIHRAYANYGGNNVQPEESFPNRLGLYVQTYIDVIREAADIWSTPLIDLFRDSGLHPLTTSHGQFFNNPQTDLLHPSTVGHARIARTMMRQMMAMPSDFK